MAEGVEVIGVYEVPDAGDAHLIEVRSATRPEDLDIAAFTQEQPGQSQADWQVPWLEQWLDPDGERLITEPFEPPPEGLSESRLVFFFHFVSFDRPLFTPGGTVALPAPTTVPERLSGVEYEPVD